MSQERFNGQPIEARFADELAKARSLLNPGFLRLEAEETNVPMPVQNVIRQLTATGIWFRLSRNLKAESCADAAHKRNRGLGQMGIPLHDELKTFLGQTIGPDGQEIIVMVHCRGDQDLDFDLIEKALKAKAPLERLSPDKISALGVNYGLINPFTGAETVSHDRGQMIYSPFVQVFDSDVILPPTVPPTMMTNTGDYTWAVEFDTQELIKVIFRAKVVTVTKEEFFEGARFANSRLALLTGNSPESGMSLLVKINEKIRAALGENGNFGDVSLPNVTFRSVPAMGLTMDLSQRREQVWRLIRPVIEELAKQEPDVLTIACNTTPYFTQEIAEMLDRRTTLLTTPRVTLDFLKARQISQVALIGIPYVAELEEWSAFLRPLREAGVEVEKLSPKALERINELAFAVKRSAATEANLTSLANVLRDILDREVNAQTIAIALTEISQLLPFTRRSISRGKTLIDTLDLLANAVALRLLKKPFVYSATY